jgi:hypothetical protein
MTSLKDDIYECINLSGELVLLKDSSFLKTFTETVNELEKECRIVKTEFLHEKLGECISLKVSPSEVRSATLNLPFKTIEGFDIITCSSTDNNENNWILNLESWVHVSNNGDSYLKFILSANVNGRSKFYKQDLMVSYTTLKSTYLDPVDLVIYHIKGVVKNLEKDFISSVNFADDEFYIKTRKVIELMLKCDF